MHLRDKLFSLAFLSFLIFSPLSSVVENFSKTEEVYTYSDVSLSNLGFDTDVNYFSKINLTPEAALAVIYDCDDITSNFSDFDTSAPVCAPRSIPWTIRFRFPAEDVAAPPGSYKIQFFWDLDNNPGVFSTVNAVWTTTAPGLPGYQATDTHVYPIDGDLCTFNVRARLAISTVGVCTGSGEVPNQVLVWDKLSNVNLGTHDIDWDPTSGGALPTAPPVAETVDVCAGDNTAVRIRDISIFNCQPPAELIVPNQNDETRWVQWVYGVAGTTIADDVIIDGVTYTPAQWPVYGTPTFQQGPPGIITAPTAVTDDIQMPITASVGQIFKVGIRSWNVCNPYSNSNTLVPDGGGPFLINNPPGTLQSALPDTHADAAPIPEIYYDIRIADKPPLPTSLDKDYCYNTNLGSATNPAFEIDPSGATNVAVEWYEDNAGVINMGAPITNNRAPLGNSLFLQGADYTGVGGPGLTGTDVGTYYVWARYSANTGSQNCWSDPVRIQLDIREQLSTPTNVTSSEGAAGFTVCADNGTITFTVTDGPPGVGTPGGAWEYDWAFGGGTQNDDITFSSPDGLQSRDVDITDNNTSGLRRVRVRRRYIGADDNGSTCQSGYRNFDFNIDAVSIGGTVAGGATVCSGDANNITVTLGGGFRGTIDHWERDTGSGMVNIGNGGVNPLIETATLTIPTVAETWTYQAVLKNGVCATATSSTTSFTVNPYPPTPTITEVSGPGITTICEDGSNVILESSDVAGLAESYLWYKAPNLSPGDEIQNAASNQLFALNTPAQSGTYHVVVEGTGPSHCLSPMSLGTTVTINALPSASVAGGGSVCGANPAPDIVFTMTGTGPFDLTYEMDGAPTTVNGVASPYTIAGPTLISGPTDVYLITDVVDLGVAPNCTVSAPHANITGTATVISGGAAPVFTNFVVDAAVCDNNGVPVIPSWHVDTDVNGDYEIDYTIDGNPQATLNKTVVGAPTTIDHQVTYGQLGNTPGTYTIALTSAINTTTGCVATLPGGSVDIIVNADPADPANAVGAIACSADATGATLMVDDPGAGFTVEWYSDIALTISAVGVTGGNNEEQFTPASTATITYYTQVVNDVTSCPSISSLAVQHTQDLLPTAASAGPDFSVCTDSDNLIAVAADNGGLGTWKMQDVLYYDNFDSPTDDGLGAVGPLPVTITEPTNMSWSLGGDYSQFTTANNYLKVASSQFEARNVKNEVVWTSRLIDISGYPGGVDASVDLDNIQNGQFEPTDYIRVYHKINGGAEVLFTNGNQADDFAAVTATANGLVGNDLQIVIRILNTADNEETYFDNIIVRSSALVANPIIADIHDPNSAVSNLQFGANIFTWEVTGALNVCTASTANLTIIRNTLPDALDPTPVVCEDLFGGNSNLVADLTIYDDGITGIPTSTDRTIEYFDSPGRLPGDLINPPTNHLVTTVSNIVYTRVTRTDVTPMCTQDGTLTFTIISRPDAIDQDAVVNPTEAEFCEDFPVGSGVKTGIDLTTMDNDIVNNLGSRTVTWFTDAGYSIPVPDETNASANDGTNFYARVTETASGQACTNDAVVTITVNTRPADNAIIGANTQCVAGPTSLYQVTPGPGGTTYNWNIPAQFTVFGGGTINDFFVLLQFPVPTVQTLEVTEINPDGCAGNLQQLPITVQASPPISAITGPADVCENEAGVAYSVTNTANTDYAWTVPVGASIILGQGTSAIIVNFGNSGGNVEVVPTSQGGGCTGGTATLGVTVNPLPVLDPALSATVCSDADINITLAADGGSPVAAAAYNVTASVSPGLVANTGPTTGNGLTAAAIFNDNYTNTTGGPLTVTYTVTPVSADLCAGPSVNVVATINPEPVMASGLDVTACSDIATGLNLNTAGGSVVAANYNITAIAVPGGLTADAGNSVVPAIGVAASYLNNHKFTNTGNTPLVVQYTVEPVSGAACIGNPLVINVNINPEPVIDPTLNTTICSDIDIGVTLNTNGVSVGAANYNLVNVAIPGGVTADAGNVAFPTNGVASNFIIGDSYTNQTSLPLNVVYEVKGVSASACLGDSEFITVTIDPEPIVTTTLSSTVCSDAAAGITFTSVGTAVAAADYNVVAVTIPAGAIPAGTNAAIPGNNVVNTYISADMYTNKTAAAIDVIYEVRGVSGAGCVGDSEFITLTVDPEPVVDPALDATVCSDISIGVTFNTNGTSVAAASYDLLGIVIAGGLTPDAGNVPTANTVAANYIANDKYTNTTNASLTATYEVRGKAAGTGCNGDSEFIVVTVDPEPVISPALNTTVCSDFAVGVTFTNNGTSIPAANYNVVSVTIPGGLTAGGGNVAIPAAGVVSGYISSDTYTNQTGGPLVVIYDVQGVSGAGCTGDIESVSVTVNPEPVIDPGLDATVCSDAATGLTLNTNGVSVGAANYNIVAVTIPAGLTAGANAVIPANSVVAGYLAGDTYTNQTNAPIVVTYEVKGVSGGACIGDSEFINITIDPEPVVDNTLGGTVCSDDIVGLVLATDAGSVPAVNYNVTNVTIAAGLVAGGGNAAIPGNNVPIAYLATDTYRNPTNGALNVSYDVQGNSAAGCTGDIETITIVIDPEPVISPALDKTVCSDNDINLTLATNGTSVVAANYNVKAVTIPAGLTAAGTNAAIPGNGVAAGYLFTDSYTNQTAAAINVTYEVTGVSAAACEGDSEFIIVTINPEPVVDPALDATICSDAIVGVTMNSDGTSVAAANYNIVNVTISAGLVPSGTNVAFPANTVAANYFINDTYENTTGGALTVTYDVQGVSAVGCIGDTESILITINPEPVVDMTLDATICSDQITNLTLATDGASTPALNYNILNVTVPAGLTAGGGNAVVPANGVATNYLQNDVYTNQTNAAITVIYEVVGVSALTCVGNSEFINITIDPEPVISPALDKTVCSDNNINLTLATNGTSVAAANYNVKAVTIPAGLTAAGGNAVIPGNGVAANYIFTDSYTNQTAAAINVTYEVTGASAAACEGDSEFIVVTINPEPVVDPALDVTICSDDIVGVTMNTNGTSVVAANYNIVNVTIAAGLVAGGTNVVFPANSVADNYFINDTYENTTGGALTVTYDVQAVSAAACIGDTESIVITINPEPVVDIALDATVCSDEITNLTLATAGGSTPALNYNVLAVTVPAGLTAAVTNAAIPANNVVPGYMTNDTYTNQTNGSLIVIYEVRGVSALGCVGNSEFINITIDPEPVVNSGLNTTVCSDAVIGVTLNTDGISVAAANYNVKGVTIPAGVTAGGGNVAIPGNGVAAGYIFSDTYTNQTGGALVVIYEVTGVSGAACEGDSEFINVTINPEPVIDPALDATVCSDDVVGVNLATNGTSVVAANYNIVSVTIPAALTPAGTNVAFPANGVAANYFTNDTYTNQTTGQLIVNYEVRGVSASGCIGDSEIINVTINPEPVVSNTLNTTVCSDELIAVNLTTDPSSVGALNYNIVGVSIAGGLTPAGSNVAFPVFGVASGYISGDSFTNTTAGTLNVTYNVQGVSAAGCTGDTRSIIVSIDPEPVIDPALDVAICSDVAIGLNFATNGVSVAAANYNLVGINVGVGLVAGGGNVVPANGINANYASNDIYTNLTNAPIVVIYEVRGVSVDGCIGDSEFINVTIDPEPTMNAGLDNTLCSDIAIGLSLSDDGVGVGATTFNIVGATIPAGLTAGVGNAALPANGVVSAYLSADTYNNVSAGDLVVVYEVKGVSAAGCIGDSRFISMTIMPEPVISLGLNTTVCSDDAIGVTLNTNGTSVVAADYDIVAVSIAGGLTPGVGNAVFPANNVAAGYISSDTYTNQSSGALNVTYTVRGRSAAGCIGENQVITVTINPEPVISNALDNTICSDASIGLVLNTNGTSIGASNYNIISITVDPGLTPDPGNVAIPANGVAAAYLSNDKFTNATSAPLNVIYEVSGVSFSACEGDNKLITISIEPGPVVDPNLDATICSESAIGVTLGVDVGSVAATSYNVVGITPNPSLIPGGGNVPIANGVPANYIASDTYTNTTSISLTVVYEVKAVSAATCRGPSEFITVTIDPEPVIDPGLDKTVCSDVAVGLILNTNGVSVGASTYNVLSVTIPAGITPNIGNAAIPAAGVVDGYLSADAYTNVTNGPLVVTYEARGESLNTCEGQSRFINITIDPEPVIDPGLNSTVCSDIAVGVSLNTNGTSVAAAAYNIIAVTVPAGLTASGSNVAIPANGVAPGYFTADSYTNITNGTLDVIYEVKGVSAAGCIGDSEFITVSINPEPVVDPALTNTVCSDEILGLNLATAATSVAAANYDVLSVTIPVGLAAGANAAIPGNGVGIGYISNDTYTNLTASPIDVTYEVRANSIAGCTGNSEFIDITINPEPVLNPGLNTTVCSDAGTGIVFSTNGTSVTAANYNLTAVTPQIGLIADAGNALPGLGVLSTYIQNDRFTNPTSIPLTVQYTVEPVSPQACIGDPLIIILTVNPEPVLDPALSPAPVCSDVASGVILTVDVGSVAAAQYDIVNISWDPALIPGGSNASIGTGQAANAIAGDTYTNTSNVQKLVTYDIVPVSADNCQGDVQQVIFTINPAPALSPTLNRITCSDQASGIVLTTDGVSTPAQNYEVQSAVFPGLTPNIANTVLPITTNNTLVINGDLYTNPTNNTLTATYTIVPISAAGCRGPSRDVILTVEPTITAVANNTTATICSNSQVNITLSSPSVPSAGNIAFNMTAVASSPNISGYIPALNFLPQGYVIGDFLVNSGNTSETVTYTITPVASGGAGGVGCTGASVIEVVTVDPLPIITPGQFDIVCSTTATSYTINTLNNLAGTTFTWPAPTLSDPGLTGGSARGTASVDPIQDTFINTTNVRQSATYDVTPIGPSTCVGAMAQIIVYIDPSPDGTIAVDQPIVCMNGSAILNFTMTVGVAPFEIVYSDGTTDFTVSNIANSHFIAKNALTTTTTYELKSILDVNGCLVNLSGQTVTVTVEEPVADFTADVTSDCTPLDVTFTNNDVQVGTQYTWNWGDGSPEEITSAATVMHSFVNNSTVSDISYNVMMTAQRTNGTVVCTQTKTEFVTIKAGVNLSIATTTTEGCSPVLASFENTSQGVLNNKWFWREQGTTDENDIKDTFFASFVLQNLSATSKVYEVVYQGDRNGCGDEIVTEVVVHPELVADYTVTPGTNINIDNPVITVTNTTVSKANWDHVWEWGDGETTTNVDPGSHTYAAFGQYELKLTITDPGGNCTSEKIETITVAPVLPEVDFTVDITEGCRSLTVNFTNLSTSVDPNTYLWEFTNDRGSLLGTSNLENPSFTFFAAGRINVSLSGSNPLGITDIETKLELIEVYELPTASFTVSPATVYLPNQLLFTSNLSALADAFEWDFNGDGDVDSEEFEPQFEYESAGVYNVSLVATNTATTCSDTFMIEKAVKVVEAGTADIPNGFFPGSGDGSSGNPGGPGGSGPPNSVFLPRIKGVRDDGFNMQMFDRWGHLLFESTDQNIGWTGRDNNGKLYPTGVYVYKLELVFVSGQQTTMTGDVTLIR